jgi:hypothetical protein
VTARHGHSLPRAHSAFIPPPCGQVDRRKPVGWGAVFDAGILTPPAALLERDSLPVKGRDESRARLLRRAIRANHVETSLQQLARLMQTHFDPNQPRVPAGSPQGREWTDTGAGRSAIEDSESIGTLRRISADLQARCWSQYMQDVFQCRMVGLRACYEQAALRHANCLAELPIPPLNY